MNILQKVLLRDIKHKQEIIRYYDNHHKKLNQLTIEKFNKYDKCTIIDCHSFSDNNYCQKDQRVKSVMIEINKKLYIESDNITKNR